MITALIIAVLTQDILRQYSKEHNIIADDLYDKIPAIQLPQDDPFLKGYFQSLMPYCVANKKLSSSLAELKVKEAVEILLNIQPSLKNMLFNFNEPHKIDIEAFMNLHFSYNVPLTNFARLTGRSLAGFKRDFGKVFHTSPGLWLLDRRLKEAHFLIKEKRKKPSDVYLDVGFENLSHFSAAFKKVYGKSPSMIS
jgi:AraC-like DNA-binding protein